MEHGLKYITSYIQKHIEHLAICYNLPLVRDKALGSPEFVRRVYHIPWFCVDITIHPYSKHDIGLAYLY